ncbi:hypothetical protein [Hymenobacter cellulosilyticus]|uniref:Uncharacterized protein n=1 Tax=Hymenobacter cellulosilyticus TaxID=2932248 RepID=A0A8T9Q466_9BACT|nr:hypothetical protein [Hymenobacter cellulosilyticus]UOQ70688.1 hypothetical protein MUN79_18545 [Hymenobacter cellulosilyticus]
MIRTVKSSVIDNSMRTNKARRYDEQVDREIKKALVKFSQHLMSNSKWVRLINKLVENADKILRIEFKKVQEERIGELYLHRDTSFKFDYWQNGFEGCNSLGGWLAFEEIEFLAFPRIVDGGCNKQDVEQIMGLINSVGQFSLDISEDRLKLICYRE